MDALSYLSQASPQSAQHLKYRLPEKPILLLTLTVEHGASNKKALLQQYSLPKDSVLNRLDCISANSEACLILVTVWQDDDDRIFCSSDTFSSLVTKLGINQAYMYPHVTGLHGFFQASNKRGSGGQTFVLGTVSFTAIWRFEPSDSSTKCLLLCSEQTNTRLELLPTRLFPVLEAIRERGNDSRLLPFALAAVLLDRMVKRLRARSVSIRGAELVAGYGFAPNLTPLRYEIDELIHISRVANKIMSSTASSRRYAEWINSLLNHCRAHQSEEGDMAEAVRILESYLRAALTSMSFLESRAKNLSSVVSGRHITFPLFSCATIH